MAVGCALSLQREAIMLSSRSGMKGGPGGMGEAPIHRAVGRGEEVIAYPGGKRRGRSMQMRAKINHRPVVRKQRAHSK
jgi:hypothetical protein